jgi:hypothetical protein
VLDYFEIACSSGLLPAGQLGPPIYTGRVFINTSAFLAILRGIYPGDIITERHFTKPEKYF